MGYERDYCHRMNPPIRSAADSSLVTRGEQRAILTVTCSAAFLFFNSFGSIGVALPTMQKQFGSSLAAIQWVSLMGIVTVSSLSLCFGRAGGIFGQRRIYKSGVALYAIGAGFGAVANSFSTLLSARLVMAVGLAMAVPMSTAILATAFESKSRGRALGTFASAIAVGRMTGPTIGGVLLELGGWPWIFWMNFIIGSAVTIAVAKIFPGSGEQRQEPFDVWGSLLLLLSYPALLLGLTFAPSAGWTSSFVAGCFIVALIGLPIFVWVELHAKKPLIEMAMFKRKLLAAAVGAAVLSNVTHYPLGLCAPLYLQNVLGASAVITGLVLAILPFSTALASWVSGRLADRFDAGLIACLGLLFIFGGIVYYSGLETDRNLLYVIGALAAVGTGLGIFTPANQKVAFASVQQDDYGVLAAILSSFGTAAGTVGTTMAVALMELRGGQRLWAEPTLFASAQQFAFSCLAPIGLLALLIACLSRDAGSHR
jgi:EmrB/QacA subfamily drug resistance transporter